MQITWRSQVHPDKMDEAESKHAAYKLSRKCCAIDKIRSRFIIAITGDRQDALHYALSLAHSGGT